MSAQTKPFRLLLATDGSTPSRTAEQLVAGTRWPAKTSILALRVLDPVPAIHGVPADAQDAFAAQARERADGHLTGLTSELATGDRAVDCAVIPGRAGSLIVDEARRISADLIVMGSRGRGAMASTVLGSVAAEVVDHAPCPVLVARAPAITSIVVADDGSEHARHAEEVLAGWSFLRGRHVRVVSVLDLNAFVGMDSAIGMIDAETYQSMFDELRSLHAGYARDAAERLRALDPNVTSTTCEGFVAGEIMAAAAEAHADLVVVGTRGRTGLRRLVLGSIARNVLFHSPTSVLVVRPRTDADRK